MADMTMRPVLAESQQRNIPAVVPRARSWRASISMPLTCACGLVLVALRLCSLAISEPDIWWHLRDAAYLFAQHALPRVDMFSFTAAGAPWINHEWLSEIPYLLGFRALGLRGILLVYFTLVALIYLGTYYRALREGADCKNALVVCIVGLLMGTVSIGPRMLLFGWLCMVALLMITDRFRRTGKSLWLLPPLFALWINLHGSWLFGMVVLTLIVGAGLVQGEWGLVTARRWSRAELRKLAGAATASALALFANPYGYHLVAYPFELLTRQAAVTSKLEEWQPVDFATDHGKLALLMILGVIAAALFPRQKWRLDQALLTAFALSTALVHVRFLFFAALVLVPILAPRLQLFAAYEPARDKPLLNAALILLMAIAAPRFFPTSAALQRKVEEQYPAAALRYMADHRLNGRIFNSYGWGGYMEWHRPDLKPFVDGRADIFIYNGAFSAYADTVFIRQPLEILEQYKIDYVLTKPETHLTYVLDHAPGWRAVYLDKVAAIYSRQGQPEIQVGE
jgi:hypothetical protein